MLIRLTNIIERDSISMIGQIGNTVRLTNELSSEITMRPTNPKSQWLLKTGFYDDGGIWDDDQYWID